MNLRQSIALPVWRGFALAALLLAGGAAAARAQAVGECGEGEANREIRSLTFQGNHAFSSRDLALRVVTTPSSMIRRLARVIGSRRCLDSDALRLDVGRLRVYYRRHGYYSTAVDTVVDVQRDSSVRVTFSINEGEPVLVDTLRYTGLDSAVAPVADVGDLELQKGRPFGAAFLQSTRDSIKARLRNEGYPAADVAASYQVDSAAHRATVVLNVIPGLRKHIGTVRVFNQEDAGERSRLGDEIIRNLLPVQPGDLYSDRAINDAQRSLYQSELFRAVDVRVAPDSTLPGGTSERDSLVTLDVIVHEQPMRQIETEVGWAVSDCFKERTRYIDKNFLGGARRLELTAQVSKLGYGRPTRFLNGSLCAPAIQKDTFSTRLNYFVGGTVRLPSLFGVRTAPSFSVYTERRGEYQTYLRSTVIGGAASITPEIAFELPLRIGYSLEYGHTEAQPALLCAVFSRCDSEGRKEITERNRPLAVGSAHLDWLRTDNPFMPRQGHNVRLDFRLSARELGSNRELEFAKGLVDASYYHPMTQAVTFAARGRLGIVLGRTLSFNDSTGFVPPEERLYAGGATSVRGFSQNNLGALVYTSQDSVGPSEVHGDTAFFALPPGGGNGVRSRVPVGGTSLVVLNLEFRFRSRFYPELLQWTLFADAGDVWQRGTALGTATHRASSLYLNALKWTPGVGARMFTPVGPIQLNVAYNPFAEPAGAIYYDAPVDRETGIAPLYCVTPGNRIPAVRNANGVYEQDPTIACPATFQPAQKKTLLSRLTLSFSIGPDF